MERPASAAPVAVYEAIQRLLDEGDTVSLSHHARQRARERRFTMDDVVRVLRTGVVAAEAEWHELSGCWRYRINGRDCDGDALSLIVVVEPTLARITVITAF